MLSSFLPTPIDGAAAATGSRAPGAPSMPVGHRRDIDGLRAVAVLPIVLGHAGVRGFGGGFIGVDVFFVISGFLITDILLRDIAAGRHSLAEFYRRRILRIFPALFAMLAVVTLLALPFTLPGETLRYARSLGATVLFGSNALFYGESGYFDTASHAKPLLHTWSLAVEEQFYILWPLLLGAAGARSPAALRRAVVGVVLLSFATALWLVRADMSAAFYLLPSRAWELGLGALLAVFPARCRFRPVNEALGAAALLALAYAVWRFSPLMPFPGSGALLPCLAAATLIFSGPDTLAARLLSLPPVVFIGLISYSLYLWHWPVIVFADIGLLAGGGPFVIAAEIAASLVVATLSWRFVETPFRVAGRRWPARTVLAAGAAAIAAGLLVAGALAAARGLPGRYTPAQVAMAAYADGDFEATYRRGSCFVTGPLDELAPACVRPSGIATPVLLLGDSQAAHLWPGFSRLRDRYDVLQATLVGCRPGLYPPGAPAKCARFYRRMLTEWVPARKPGLVVLAGRWQPIDLPMIEATMATLARAGVNALVVGPLPDYRAALPRLLVLAERRGDPDLPMRSQNEPIFETDRTMRAMAERHGIAYASPIDALCRGRRCRSLVAPGVPLQFDYGHLTPQGSAVLADLLRPEIDAALSRRRSAQVRRTAPPRATAGRAASGGETAP